MIYMAKKLNKKTDALKFNFLPDAPVLRSEKEYYEFYHNFVSPALDQITRQKAGIHTIGLFGSWGSGKSTIIENLKDEYSDQPVFIFDAWKYKGDPLRRTFLIKFFEFITNPEERLDGGKLPDDYLEDLYYQKTESRKFELKLDDSKQPSWLKKLINIVRGNLLLFAVIGLSLSWWLIQLNLGDNHRFVNQFLRLVGLLAQSTVLFTLLVIFSKQAFEWLVNKFLDSLETKGKSYTLTRQKEALNSPEEFEKKFQGMIDTLTKNVVVVFDNIDRVQGDVAVEMLASIKTFLEPSKKENIIFVIPCDSDAIVTQIKRFYSDEGPAFDSSEYLRKLFNVVLWTPDFITTDLEDFTKSSLEQLGGNLSLSENDDLILVITQAFKNNPREIKQFLNNLAAALLVTKETEVWSLIKANIPYLAKCLVLKQKYPEAYRNLKEKWYEPEDIIPENSKKEDLRNFMLNTGLITVSNAEPFIYLKLPNQAREIKESEQLATALVAGNQEEVNKITEFNKTKAKKMSDYVAGLYPKYSAKPEWLTNVIKTYLTSIDEVSIEVKNSSGFLNRTAEMIDKSIWQSYRQLPIQIVFEKLIKDRSVKKAIRKSLTNRYISVLRNEELKKEEGADFVVMVLENLRGLKLEEDQGATLRNTLAEGYSHKTRVIELFKNIKDQKAFVSKECLSKFVQNIGDGNYKVNLPILVQYKKFIGETDLANQVVESFVTLINNERAKNPQDNPNIQTLIESFGELTKKPDSVLETTDDTILSKISTELITAYQNISNLDSKAFFIPILYGLRFYLEDDSSKQVSDVIKQFVQQSSPEVLNKIIDALSEVKLSGDFVNQFVDSFAERAVANDGSDIQKAYDLMDDPEKQQVLVGMVKQRPDFGLTFIRTIKRLPERVEIVSEMLTRVNTLPQPRARTDPYEWITSNIKRNDDKALKDIIFNHIVTLLKSDQPESQEVGLNLLQRSTFLSETDKRRIGDEIKDWLRTPGKTINNNHEHALGALAYIFKSLQTTVKNDFIYILFGLLDRQEDRQTLDTALRILNQVKPSWKEYQSHFIDFKEKVASWTNVDNKNSVITGLTELQSSKPTKKEEAYWKELEKLKIDTSKNE